MHHVPGQFRKITRDTDTTRKKDKVYLTEKSIKKNARDDITNVKTCKIVSYASSTFNKQFNTTTNIIAERIVSKEMELKDFKRISDTSGEFRDYTKLERVNKELGIKQNNNQRSAPRKFQGESLFSDKFKDKPRSYKSPFLLSTRKSAVRIPIKHTSVEVKLKACSDSSISTQTQIEPQESSYIQTHFDLCTSHHHVQTPFVAHLNKDTNTEKLQAPTKSTNTDKPDLTLIHNFKVNEYMSDSDLYCLRWIKNYLLNIDIDPTQIVYDEKIRDVSEVCTKSSTTLSDLMIL